MYLILLLPLPSFLGLLHTARHFALITAKVLVQEFAHCKLSSR